MQTVRDLSTVDPSRLEMFYRAKKFCLDGDWASARDMYAAIGMKSDAEQCQIIIDSNHRGNQLRELWEAVERMKARGEHYIEINRFEKESTDRINNEFLAKHPKFGSSTIEERSR